MAEYAPRNLAYGVPTLNEHEAALKLTELEFERLRLALDSARRRLIQAHWTFHNGMLGARSEVITQFGPDSEYVPAVGLKRKSDRKRPTRRPKSPSL